MKRIRIVGVIIFILVVSSLSFAGGYLLRSASENDKNNGQIQESHVSPYSGEEIRGIKSLSQEEIKGLLAGEGAPFGGMAKLAELNGYPGPRHALDMTEELKLSNRQSSEIENLYKEMGMKTIPIGKKIIALEKEMNDAFSDESITSEELESKVAESAELYGQLRYIHLKYHFLTKNILSVSQIQKYNELRGYIGGGDPCENIPEGHDIELWKMHNNCN